MLEVRIRQLLIDLRQHARGQGINAELYLHRERSNLVRLGNSAVALSTAEHITRLTINVLDGRREGGFNLTEDITSQDQLRTALDRAVALCRQSPDKDYDPIFGQVQEAVDDTRNYDPQLEELAPKAKAEFCARVIEKLKPRGNYDFSGSWSTGSSEIYYTTTANDKECYRRLSDGRLMLVLQSQDRKWELLSEQGGKGTQPYSADAMIAEFDALLPLYEKATPVKPATGHQRIVFGPQAIALLGQFTVWLGCNGLAWEEKRSFTTKNKIGDRIFNEHVTLIDDPDDPNVYGLLFDFSGFRRRRFPLVEQGILRGIMYGAFAAAKHHKPMTGHTGGFDLKVGTGAGPAGLKAGLELAGDALYIPHLHYGRPVDPPRGLFTGSSRFNARRVEQGRFTAPLLSSRVTDTLTNVLSNVVAVSSQSLLFEMSNTYGARYPDAVNVPEYMICDNVRISDVADSF
jgi:predicted Zn-dependent protease